MKRTYILGTIASLMLVAILAGSAGGVQSSMHEPLLETTRQESERPIIMRGDVECDPLPSCPDFNCLPVWYDHVYLNFKVFTWPGTIYASGCWYHDDNMVIDPLYVAALNCPCRYHFKGTLE